MVEIRDRCLVAPSGLILPNEYYVYFHGITNEELMTDVKSRWKFPYGLDYTFLDDLVMLFDFHNDDAHVLISKHLQSPREILPWLQSRPKTIISTKCLLRQINLNTLSLGHARAFSTPFFLTPLTEDCKEIHAFSLHLQASCSPLSMALKYHQDEPSHVMPLPQPIVLTAGDFIRGVFTLGICQEDETLIDWQVTLEFKHPLRQTLTYQLREYIITPSSLYA